MAVAFNCLGIVATLGMSKNRHIKVLVENKNDILEVILGKARMVHVFRDEMIIVRLAWVGCALVLLRLVWVPLLCIVL